MRDKGSCCFLVGVLVSLLYIVSVSQGIPSILSLPNSPHFEQGFLLPDYPHRRSVSAQPTCWSKLGNFPPTKVGKIMESCCWYADSTCCSTHLDSPLPAIVGYLGFIFEELEVSDTCYFSIANAMCHACAPNTVDFVDTTSPNVTRWRICLPLCDTLFTDCKSELYLLEGGWNTSINNGEQLCQRLFSQDKENLVVVNSTEHCFGGVPRRQVVQSSYCLPGIQPPPPQRCSDGLSSSDIALIVLIPVLVIALVIVIILLVAVARGKSFFTPSALLSIADTDKDFAISMDAFKD